MNQELTVIDRLAAPLLRLRNRHFLLLDVAILLFTPSAALLLRMEEVETLQRFEVSLAVITLLFLGVKVLVFYVAGLYQRYWKYASIDELAKITGAVVGAVVIQTALFFLVLRPLGGVDPSFPRSVPLIEGLLALVVMGGSRYSVRLAQRMQQRLRRDGDARHVLVVGAGAAGMMVVQEMRTNPQLGLLPVAFVDDNPEKQGMRIRGLDVLGSRKDIPRLVRELRVAVVVIAIPRAPGKTVREIAEICRKTGAETKTVPGVYELLDDSVTISQLRDVQVEDLLRRAPVRGDRTKMAALLRGRRVLVTGAGGSIGAELCRQIMSLGPSDLVLLGHGENSIFRIEAELRRRLTTQVSYAVRLHSVIADVRDRPRMEHVFGLHEPEVVFHAAAHKHVPLMESNVEDAVTNNVQGTRTLLELAAEAGVERFVFISTDKAVNPTNVMGATKRIAELLVRDAAVQTDAAFMAVRFGNVLGSRGSVLEVFRKQLQQGGPLTVTDPEVQRYFMTIPESVYLVLQAAAMGTGGETFVLDMGEPVRILDLARDLIRLSGMEEGHDVDIVFTGLRPGEKLHEALVADGEHFGTTEHEKILVCRNGTDGWNTTHGKALCAFVGDLVAAARQGDTDRLHRLIGELVPSYPAVDKAPTSTAPAMLSVNDP